MKIVEKDDNTKVALSEVEVGDVFEWGGKYFMKVEQDDHISLNVAAVNLAAGTLETIPPYAEVTPVKASLFIE